MTINFLIAPDFAPERSAGWHMLNTTLQRRSGIGLHLLTPVSAPAGCIVGQQHGGLGLRQSL